MSEENNRTPVTRKQRVKRLKKLIVLTLAISIIVPWVLCIVLLAKVQGLSDDLQTMSGRMSEVNSLLESLLSETNTQGTGSVLMNQAAQNSEQDVEQEIEAGEEASNTVTIMEEEPTRKVYLTFDDGPSIYTEDILDILDQYNIKATFMVVGKEDESSQEALRQIVERGHTLGMHSYTHVYREIYESVDSFAYDFMKIQNYLYDVTGVRSTIYRFPGGSSNKVSDVDMKELAGYLQEQDVVFYDWNISSGDGSSTTLSVQEIVDNCTKNIENLETAIILLHDSGDKRTTVEALPIVIENILALEDTEILPITEDTVPVQHINTKVKE